MKQYDVLIMGAGIVGLAAAYAATQRGLRVAIVEQHASCIGASIRNFGFITVSGQRAGKHWQRALHSSQIWADLAPQAGITILQRGLLIPAYRPEAAAVCEAFLQTEMGEQCTLISATVARQHAPNLQAQAECYLYSPHELRVESRQAIPQLAVWLQATQGVDIYWSCRVEQLNLPDVVTSQGVLRANKFIGCPGHHAALLPPTIKQQAGIEICTLQMLRLQAPTMPTLAHAVMSDLSLARYEGFADLPAAQALKQRLQQTCSAHLKAGVHLIVVQSADGSLVVGDSHVYGDSEAPFAHEAVDALILQAFDEVFALPERYVSERWLGSYASAAEPVFSYKLDKDSIIGLVTGGTGASTGFAFAEELVTSVLEDDT